MKKTVSKVRENVRQFTSRGENYYVHVINFEGDAEDFSYNSKTATCTKFKGGEEVEVEVSEDNFGNKKVKPVSNFQPSQLNVANKKNYEPKDQGLITALSIYSSTCQRLQGSSEAKNYSFIEQECERAFNWAMSKSDNK